MVEVVRELTDRGGARTRGMPAGMRVVNAGCVLDASRLVTAANPLGRIAEAFETAAAKLADFVTAVIEPA